jgi:hypothetical protein
MPQQSTSVGHLRRNTLPEDELGSLPEGWEERVHTDGRIFFIDHSKSISIC